MAHRSFQVTPAQIRIIAIAMGSYIILILWPAFDLSRLLLAHDPQAFSLVRAGKAVAFACLFSCYAYWQMTRLCLAKNSL